MTPPLNAGKLGYSKMGLNRSRDIEPHKFHTCIHLTFRSLKNKYALFLQIQNKYITIYSICVRTGMAEFDVMNDTSGLSPG